MAQVLVRNLSNDVVRRLKERASLHGSSLEEELRRILSEAARLDMPGFRRRAAEIRSGCRQPQQTDSVQLLREDRDR